MAEPWLTLLQGDAQTVLATLPTGSVDCCVTSPPYWGLRDYGVAGQLGLEATPAEYVAGLLKVFREVWRVLRADGTLWLNMGDSYAGSWGAQSRRLNHEDRGRAFRGISRGQIAAAPQLQSRTGSIPEGSGLKAKDLVGMPWMVAFALRATGWYLRADIIWSKPNPMPESVTDRPTKAHEYLFLLSQAERYYYDADAIRESWMSGRDDMRENGLRTGLAYVEQPEVASNHEYAGKHRDSGPGAAGRRLLLNLKAARDKGHAHDKPFGPGRNKRSVWEVATAPYPDAHFATFPPDLIKPCILAGCPEGGVVLDPFVGSGTTAAVANQLGRRAIGIELSPAYLELARKRCSQSVIWEVS